MEAGAAPARISYERIAVDSLLRALSGLAGIQVYRGQAGGNRFAVPGWELTLGQQFQFGDLRVETATATILVEFESAGGVGNLVKYWPLLAEGPRPKRFVIVHVFQIGSVGDYIAHRRLWEFLRERMRDDLDQRGVAYPAAWEAQLFTHRRGEEAADAADFVRASCGVSG